MKSTFIGKETNEVSFTMDFTAEDFEAALVKAYHKNKGKYALDGFRKGKAPRKLIETKYGEDIFYEDAINQLFHEGYPQALDEMDIEPVDKPSVDFGEIDKEKGFSVTVKVTVVPEFEVKDYKGVQVAKVDTTITDKDVEKDLEALQKRNSRMIVIDGPAKEGDTLLIDYTGYVGEDVFEGGTAERQPLTLGSNTFIPGFEEQLIGAAVGEERDVKVTFPEEYHSEELAGKEAVFKCKVHEIKETELPPIDDEFAKEASEFDTLEELKQDIRTKLEKLAEEKAEYEIKNSILEKVYEANEVDIPDIMVEDQMDEMLQELDQQLRYQGLDLQKYLTYTNKEISQVRQEIREDAHKKVKSKLVVEAVANVENLLATEEDIEKELAAMAEQYKIEPEKLRGMLSENGLFYLEKDIKNRKAIDFMFENAVIE
ncbi:MAG: trigger factor [Eubacteriales bacterium]|nr:trigger factor [Eubacteriales bacterium]MDD4583738.1 trigger factor [Eubacteriales bacterium]